MFQRLIQRRIQQRTLSQSLSFDPTNSTSKPTLTAFPIVFSSRIPSVGSKSFAAAQSYGSTTSSPTTQNLRDAVNSAIITFTLDVAKVNRMHVMKAQCIQAGPRRSLIYLQVRKQRLGSWESNFNFSSCGVNNKVY